jgi:hypothetical protein
MPDPMPPGEVVAAAEQLRELLTTHPAYRRRWMAHAHRMRTSEINYAAVSQVVALYLWDHGLKADADRDLPRKLRDRVRQALRGEQLTYETLTWLIEAFEFNTDDTHKVWGAFAGGSMTSLGDDGIAFTLRTLPVPIVRPQRHRTTALFSRYYIGMDRTLNRIETSHVIVALEDGVDTFAYSPRDSLTDATVISGGSLVGFHKSTPGFIGVELRLARPLLKGQYASLQYFTTHRAASEQCTQLRRAARKRIDNVDMRVIFEGVYPRRSWWCAWDDYDKGNEVLVASVEVSHGSELHQFIPYVEEAVVGFKWKW